MESEVQKLKDKLLSILSQHAFFKYTAALLS